MKLFLYRSIALILFTTTVVLQSFKRVEPDRLADTYSVTTLAGNGDNRTIDGPAAKASFSSELGNLAVGNDGAIYVLDFTALRKITQDGIVTTVFGTNVYDSDGNPKPIGKELEKGARGIAIGPDGSIYISDRFGHSIRKIMNQQQVETYSGNNEYSGSDDGDALSAEFKYPKDMCMDRNGNIYLIDNYHKVRKISADGKKVITLAGNDDKAGEYRSGTGKAASFKDIGGITVDSKMNVYISQPDINCIIKISPGGVTSVFAGDPLITNGSTKDGTGKVARFHMPAALACDPNDNIYVADHRKIRRITSSGVVTTIAGAPLEGESLSGFRDGEGRKALFGGFDGIACDAQGNIYVTDIGNYRVRKIVRD